MLNKNLSIYLLKEILDESEENKYVRYGKNHVLSTENEYSKHVTKEKHRNEVKLVETDDKYDLELRFRPKHRTKISEAKQVNTFQKWDKQVKN